MQTCETCRWWKAVPPDRNVGNCKRFPPQVIEGDWEFPLTAKTDLCGEWHHQTARQINETDK